MSSTRTPRSDALANRAGIIAAARTALASDPHASVDAIARTAGVSRRTIYGHFADRDALIRELIASGARRFNALATSVDDDDPQVALARLAALMWHEAAHVRITAALALDDAHLAETAAALAPLRRVLADIVRRGRRGERMRTDIDAGMLARLIEVVARTVVSRNLADETGAEPAAAADAVVRIVLSIAGLSWRDADALLRDHPDVLAPAQSAE